MSTTTRIFHVQGMHCDSCVLLMETKIAALAGVEKATASLATHSIEVVGDFCEMDDKEVAEMLTGAVKAHGYTVSLAKQRHVVRWQDFTLAVPIALAFAFLFVLLQKLGMVNLVGGGSFSYGTAFVVGVIASLSTCMAVVGGLLLSMSATFAKAGDSLRPQCMFHGGRLVAFFVGGGIIGAIGSAFTLSAAGTFVLSMIIAVVMLILGINLLDVFAGAQRFQPSMPAFIAKRAHGMASLNHALTPLLVGMSTFFLPCGFTQSMQLYALTTGSFLSGALTMTSFALGTLPVLALISFSSFGIRDSKYAGVFFKSAGLIVILFALFNLGNALVAIGAIPPLFTL